MHGVVNGAGVVVEDAGEFLAVFDLGWRELTRVAGEFCVLLFLAVYGGGVGVWRVLWFLRQWVLKACAGFGDIVGHGEVNGSFGVVPIEMDAAEDFPFTVDGDVIVFFETVDEMVGVGLANNFDAKVVNDKIEGCGAGDVAEESGGVASGNVAISGEVLDEFDVGESSSLGKTVHACANFGEESIVFDEGSKIVFVHYIIRNGPGGNVEVLILAGVGERGDEIEIGKVEAEKGGTRSGEYTVEEELGSGEISCGRVCFASVVDKVASDGEADAVGVSFLRTMVGADAKVCGFLSFGKLIGVDEMKSVGSFGVAVLAALCKTGDLFGAALFPKKFVLSFEEVSVFFKFTGVGVEDGVGLTEWIGGWIGSAPEFVCDKLLEFGREPGWCGDGVAGLEIQTGFVDWLRFSLTAAKTGSVQVRWWWRSWCRFLGAVLFLSAEASIGGRHV